MQFQKNNNHSLLKRYLCRLYPISIFTIVIIIFYFKVFFIFSQYVQWGNFYTPYSIIQILTSQNGIFWDPLSGTPNPFPATTLENTIIYNSFLKYLILIMGVGDGMRMYIFLSSFFAICSFYLLTSIFTKNIHLRVLSTLFFFFNGFQINQLAAGDFLIFWYQGFLLFSIFFLIKAIRDFNGINYYWLISMIFLYLTVGQEQFLYLGLFLYLTFLIGETYQKNLLMTNSRMVVIKIIKYGLTGLFCIFILSLPFVLPALFGSFISLGPTSSFAQPLSEFSFFTNNTLQVLLFQPYPKIMGNLAVISMLKYPPEIRIIWIAMSDGFLLILIILSFLKGAFRTRFYSFILVFSAILGAGPHSILPILPIYLYEHLPGYQLLNTSYYWDWIIISPIYSILLLILFNDYLTQGKLKTHNLIMEKTLRSHVNITLTRIKKYHLENIFVVFILLIILLPIASQGYYNTSNGNGILNRGAFAPSSSYANLTKELHNLTSNNTGGVAFFPPGPQIFSTNQNNQFDFSYINFAPFKELLIPSYGSFPSVQSNFNLFLYKLIYGHYGQLKVNLGMLMSYAGVRYVVALKNMTDNGYNYFNSSATKLTNMTGIVEITNNSNFEIFKSSYQPFLIDSSNNLSISIGNEFSLVELANKGYGLSNQPVLLSSNLNKTNIPFILTHTGSIFLENESDLNYIALKLLHHIRINPELFVNPLSSLDASNRSWVSGSQTYVSGISNTVNTPKDFVFTNSHSTLNISTNVTDQMNQVLVEVYFSTFSSSINLSINGGRNITINASINNNSLPSFRIVPIDLKVNGHVNLSFTSVDKLGTETASLGNIFLVNSTEYLLKERYVENIINMDCVKLFYFNQNYNNSFSYANNSPFLEINYWGYSFNSSNKTFTWINYPYYSDINSNARIIPLNNSLYTLVITNGTQHESVIFTTYYYWMLGTVIQISFVSTFVSLVVISNFRSKHKKNRL